MNTKFSIITPVYNGAPYIDELIQSVLKQEYAPVEHIIIDDGSTDDGATVSVLENYPHLKWWSRDNQGQYATMNEGLLAAEGGVVCFISADDLMNPCAIQTVARRLAEDHRIDTVYGTYSLLDTQGNRRKYIQPFRNTPTWMYPYTSHIAHSSLYIRRDAIETHELTFNEQLRYVGDYDWLVRIIRSPIRIDRIQKDLSAIRIHEAQTTKTSFFQMRNEIRQVQADLGVSPFWASIFRKLMFATGAINVALDRGVNEALREIYTRIRS
jgi:glycosyltransferase involved in cell wall biosynthesis